MRDRLESRSTEARQLLLDAELIVRQPCGTTVG
jgi:hypothetical protein